MSEDSFGNFLSALEPAFAANDPDFAQKSREQANIATLIGVYRAIGSGRFAELEDLMVEDIEFVMHGALEGQMVDYARGWREVLQAIISNFAGVGDQIVEIELALAQGDLICLLLHDTGRIRTTGENYDVRVTQWFEFRDHRVVKFTETMDSYPLRVAFRMP